MLGTLIVNILAIVDKAPLQSTLQHYKNIVLNLLYIYNHYYYLTLLESASVIKCEITVKCFCYLVANIQHLIIASSPKQSPGLISKSGMFS